MRVAAVLAGAITVVFAVSLVAPWDPGASGGLGAVFALAVAGLAAILEGRMGHRWQGVATGAATGPVALAAFSTGTYTAYELGLLGATWSDWGDQDYSVIEALLVTVLYGVPAALLGGALALAGRASRRLA